MKRCKKALIAIGLASSLAACTQPVIPILAASDPDLPQDRAYELIVSVPDGRLEAVAARRLGASVQDRLVVAGQHWLLLHLDPDRLRAMPEAGPYAGVDPHDDAALTRAAAEDLSQNHAGMIKAIGFNTLSRRDGETLPLSSDSAMSPEGFTLTQATPSGSPLFNDLSFGIGSGLEGWWRTETKVEAAWPFSIGTGITAAYLDTGFVRGHPELERRLIINGRNNQTSEYHDQHPDDIERPAGDHGTASLLVGFAERENHLPSVGVAPNASFIPYVATTVWDAARALQTAASLNPDVLGMNFAFPLYPKWEGLGQYRQYQLLKDVFAAIDASKLAIAIPAHNYGEPVLGGPRDWVPVAWHRDYENIIGVGGVQVSNGRKIKAWFNPDLLTGINARGSNYGEGLIWAPATLLDIHSAHPNHPIPSSMNGTSASCPFVTAALTLLRSRLPQLKPAQLKALLLATAKPVDAYELTQRRGATVPMIQVEAALLKGLRDAGQDPERYRARSFTGRFELDATGQRYFIASDGKRWRVLPTLSTLHQGVPSPYDGQQVSIEAWTGIPPLAADEIEILRLLSPIS